jgi:hypothetical protein
LPLERSIPLLRCCASRHCSKRSSCRTFGSCPPFGPSVCAPQRRHMGIRPLVSGPWCWSRRPPTCIASAESTVSPHAACSANAVPLTIRFHSSPEPEVPGAELFQALGPSRRSGARLAAVRPKGASTSHLLDQHSGRETTTLASSPLRGSTSRSGQLRSSATRHPPDTGRATSIGRFGKRPQPRIGPGPRSTSVADAACHREGCLADRC